jgi:anthranilate phosphoribosyltransferase
MSYISETLESIIAGNHLSQDQAADVISIIMQGECTPAQTAALLIALRSKGETVDEIVGAATAMRSHAAKIPTTLTGILDTCGTGGDKSGTFNISTTSAFVAAGAGIPVAKHGNRSASSQCGSIDVLETMGVNINQTPDEIAHSLETISMGILFARVVHPAMKHAAPIRTELGIRTIFNWLGPLTNPARPSFQLVGISNPAFQNTYAQCLQKLGITKAWVVCAGDGLDEITLTRETNVIEVSQDAPLKEFTVKPEDAGLTPCKQEDLLGGTAEENAAITKAILSGEEKGPKRDAVLLNAGAGIYLTGKASTLKEGVEKAAESIDSGKAMEVLEKLIDKP